MRIDGPIFYDRIFGFHPAITAVLVLAMLGTVVAAVLPAIMSPGNPIERGAVVLPLVMLFCVFGLLWRMRVVVTGAELVITWGLLQWIRFRFPLAELSEYNSVRYSPLMDFGGWGIRRGRGGLACYNTQGNLGVLFSIGKRRFVVGVSEPERLIEAVELATNKKPGEPLESVWRTKG